MGRLTSELSELFTSLMNLKLRSKNDWGRLDMSSDIQEYFVIFDTNVLYHAYDKKADFSSFSFNSTFENIIGFVNQLDIYEHVVMLIPTVVWMEMERQIIEAHRLKLKEFREKTAKQCFPEIIVEDKGDINYAEYIHSIIEEYRGSLSSDINKVVELQVASEVRYQSIVRRAFAKRPPFEGKDKKSDKGFKDALLWESILEFMAGHDSAKIIFYSKDNIFGNELESEFSDIFPNAELTICTTEEAIRQCLDRWAKEIDIYAYNPIESDSEDDDLINWFQSSDFEDQAIAHSDGLIEKSRLIDSSSVKLLSVESIEISDQTDDYTEYSVEATIELTYLLKNQSQFKENVNVTVMVSYYFGEKFSVEDIYKTDEVPVLE